MPEIVTSHFAHRPNVDGTFDSICRFSFRTVVWAGKEDSLALHEDHHRCSKDSSLFRDAAIRQLEHRY